MKRVFPVEGFLIDGDGVLRPTDGKIPWAHELGHRQVYRYVQMVNQGRFPRIAICTGREYGSAESMLLGIGKPDSWSVIESGTYLLNLCAREKMLKHPALTQGVEEAFTEISHVLLPPILALYQDDLFRYPGNQICVAIELQNGASLTIEETYAVIYEAIKDLVQTGLVTIHHSSIAVDLSPAKIDKAAGVKFLCEHGGIDPLRLFGIGDSAGDFPMFDTVGSIGCPSNATPDCKERVRQRKGIISDYPYAAGVADILYKVTGVRAA